MPVHGASFAGGRNRFGPAVDAAYGTLQNWLMPNLTTPRSCP